MQKISGGQDSPSGEGGAAGFGGEGDTGESKAELHGGHHYLQTMVGYPCKPLGNHGNHGSTVFNFFKKFIIYGLEVERTCKERRDLRSGKPEAA